VLGAGIGCVGGEGVARGPLTGRVWFGVRLTPLSQRSGPAEHRNGSPGGSVPGEPGGGMVAAGPWKREIQR
jgi:hypothetical protein